MRRGLLNVSTMLMRNPTVNAMISGANPQFVATNNTAISVVVAGSSSAAISVITTTRSQHQVRYYGSSEGGGGGGGGGVNKRSAEDIAAWGPDLPDEFKRHDHQDIRYIDPVMDIGGQGLVGFGTASSSATTSDVGNGGVGEETGGVFTADSVVRAVDDTVHCAGILDEGIGGAAAVEGRGEDLLEGVGGVCEVITGIFGS